VSRVVNYYLFFLKKQVFYCYAVIMKKVLILVLCFVCGVANAFTTTARSAFVIDPASNAEIVDKNSDVLMPPSSMLKLMTLAVVFDEVAAGNLKMEQRVVVPSQADYQRPEWYDASKICLTTGQKILVSDAVRGLIVLSGGDAGIVLADAVAGSESAMTGKMTKLARKIGMEKSTFGNVSGLPNPNNLMTSRELAILARYLIEKHSDLYPMFSEKRFIFDEYQTEWCAQWGRNHTYNYNRLLFIMNGADGLKTGHTADGGYGMVASAQVGGRRLIGVINGFRGKNHDALANEMKRLLNYGFTETKNKILYKSSDKILDVPVWYGKKDFVSAGVARDFVITLGKKDDANDIKMVARYNTPAAAPIRVGDKLGEIIATRDGVEMARAPLVATESVKKVQFIRRIIKNLGVIFGGR
jgi:D-alanyl-D-alanine carboxypeptidase (penicillin-binding protein 5/6)